MGNKPIKITVTDPRGAKMDFKTLTEAWIRTGLSFTTLRKLMRGEECPQYPGWKAKMVESNKET